MSQIELLPTQLAFVYSPAKRKAFIGGWGAGKTTTDAWLAVYLACTNPGSRGMIAGVSYIRHVKDVLKPQILANIPGSLRVQHSDRMTTIYLDNVEIDGKQYNDVKSEILYYGVGRNGDQTAFRSEQFDWAIIDEVTSCNEYAFKFIETRLGRRSGLSILAISSTPDAPGHWLKEYLSSRDFEVHTMKTSENTYLPADYLEDMKLAYPGAFGLRYLEGLWVNIENAMFSASQIQYVERRELPARLQYVCACDPATSKTGDYFAIACLAKEVNNPKVYLVDLVCEVGVPIKQQVELLQRMQDKWNPSAFLVETTGYQETLLQLGSVNIPHLAGVKPQTDKIIRATPLASCWQNHNFYIAGEFYRKKIEDQFLSFPAGQHDDIVDACAYAYDYLMRLGDPSKIEMIGHRMR